MKRLSTWLGESVDRQLGFALLLLCFIVYLPFAGNYGMWDPWETHYGEVARQMAERNDWISLWWPGSPQDRAEFWSKTVYTFWLIALSFKSFGIEWTSRADQIASGWRAEWAARLPMILLSIAAIMSVFEAVRRVANRRAGLIAGVVLLTASQWMLVSRQAMTDIPFVAPMTIALCLAAIALLGREESLDRVLAHYERRIGKLWLRWPRSRSATVLLLLVAASVLLPLIVFCVQLRSVPIQIGPYVMRIFGGVTMIPYFLALVIALWVCGRAKTRRETYMHIAYVLCGHASLAKGPAGLALPALVLAIFLVLAGRWRDIYKQLELLPGMLLFLVSAVPWYHAMLMRHGMGFYNEFFRDNYINRAGGRHGDRGTFEYYFEYVGYGMFPWSGVVVAAGLSALAKIRSGIKAQGAVYGFAIVWFVVYFGTVTLVNTKFHHYLLPALPPLAILAGLYLDELLETPSRRDLFVLLLLAAPITFMAGRDLASFPPRVGWMFNYDYVNVPGAGRPWPLVSAYGNRYEYGWWIFTYAILATAATAALALFAWRRIRALEPSTDAPPPDAPTPEAATETPPLSGNALVQLALVAVTLFALSLALFPASPHGAAPTIPVLWYLIPTAIMVAFLGVIAWGVRHRWPRGTGGVWLLTLAAVLWAAFALDKYLIDISPHWSQKHVIAAYYEKRSSSDEPLVVFQLYWRGENFYSRNQIYKSGDPNEKTVFLPEGGAAKFKTWVENHPGKRFFVLVERGKLESVRGLLPPEARSSLTVVDSSNNKLYLAVAQL